MLQICRTLSESISQVANGLSFSLPCMAKAKAIQGFPTQGQALTGPFRKTALGISTGVAQIRRTVVVVVVGGGRGSGSK